MSDLTKYLKDKIKGLTSYLKEAFGVASASSGTGGNIGLESSAGANLSGVGAVSGSGEVSAQSESDRLRLLMNESISRKKELDSFLNDYSSLITDPEYQKLAAASKSDDEIKGIAEAGQSLEDAKETAKIKAAAESEKKAAEGKISGLSETLSESEKLIDEYYGDAARSISGDLVKRGLARSSIAINRLAAVDMKKAEELVSVNKKYLGELNAVNNEIADAERKRDEAIEELKTTAAAKIALKIEELTKERDKKIEEVIKYNNTIAEKLAEYNLDATKLKADLDIKSLEKFGKELDIITSDEFKTQQTQDIYKAMSDYLLSLSASDAKKELEGNALYRNTLSEENYKKLRDAVYSR